MCAMESNSTASLSHRRTWRWLSGSAVLTGVVLTTQPAAQNLPSTLLVNPGDFRATDDFSGSARSASVISVLGSNERPDNTQDPVAIFEKWSNSEARSGVNATVYASIYKHANGTDARATAGFFEAQDNVGWLGGSGGNNFVEGIRAHGTLHANTKLGSGYGGIFAALEVPGATHAFLIGAEAEVQNKSTDATVTDRLQGGYSASFVASSDGEKRVHAAYVVNPHTPANSQFIDGFRVPSAAPGAAGSPIVNAAFRSDAASIWGMFLADSTLRYGSIGLPNNAPIRQRNAAANRDLGILNVDAMDNLLIGYEPGLASIQLGASGVDVTIPGDIHMKSVSGPKIMTGPGVPKSTEPAGSIFIRTDGSNGARIYVSAGGGKWHAISGV